jgi:hypothetical protein
MNSSIADLPDWREETRAIHARHTSDFMTKVSTRSVADAVGVSAEEAKIINANSTTTMIEKSRS